MNKQKIADYYLPLTELTYYILLGMVSRGSYEDIIERVKVITQGELHLGLGTLYAATQKLLKDELIVEEVVSIHKDSIKYYHITYLGEYILKEEHRRLEKILKNSAITMQSISTYSDV